MRVHDTPIDQLSAVARQANSGFLLHQKALSLPNSLGENLSSSLTDLEAREAAYYGSAAELLEIRAAVAAADDGATLAIQNAKRALRPKLGDRHSAEWAVAGFTGKTLRNPGTMDGRWALLITLAKYLSEHPALESKEPKVNASILTAAANQLKSAMDRLDAKERAHKLLTKHREEAGARVRARLRSLMIEASVGLSADDPRWDDFGQESPAAIRSSKATRDLKQQAKAGKIATQRYAVAIRRAEAGRARSERLRVRAEKAQWLANRARQEADAAAASTESLFAKARQIASGIGTAVPEGFATPGRTQQPDPVRTEVPLSN